jgi:hypothetical protein
MCSVRDVSLPLSCTITSFVLGAKFFTVIETSQTINLFPFYVVLSISTSTDTRFYIVITLFPREEYVSNNKSSQGIVEFVLLLKTLSFKSSQF